MPENRKELNESHICMYVCMDGCEVLDYTENVAGDIDVRGSGIQKVDEYLWTNKKLKLK